jgi:hypothetical protein
MTITLAAGLGLPGCFIMDVYYFLHVLFIALANSQSILYLLLYMQLVLAPVLNDAAYISKLLYVYLQPI